MSSDSTSPVSHETNIYGYTPSQGVAITMVALFTISTILHLFQAIRSRLWYIFPTVIFSGVLETVGWAGRLWSHYDVSNMTAYQIQALCTVLGPTPLLAVNFVIFGRVIERLGTCYSRLTPRYYTIIFCCSDVISLFVQGAGGGLASMASKSGKNIDLGSHVMLVGIIFQLGVIVVFCTLAAEYLIRHHKDLPLRPRVIQIEKQDQGRAIVTPTLKIMFIGMGLNILFLTIRAIYRVAELAEGWGGPIMKNELYFNVLEGAMIVLAIYTYNFIHPHSFLKFD